MRLWTLVRSNVVLALLALLVLATSAEAGIFRKRRCNSGSCSSPSRPAANCQPAGYSGSYTSTAGAVMTYTNGRPASNCPGGVCPIQR